MSNLLNVSIHWLIYYNWKSCILIQYFFWIWWNYKTTSLVINNATVSDITACSFQNINLIPWVIQTILFSDWFFQFTKPFNASTSIFLLTAPLMNIKAVKDVFLASLTWVIFQLVSISAISYLFSIICSYFIDHIRRLFFDLIEDILPLVYLWLLTSKHLDILLHLILFSIW